MGTRTNCKVCYLLEQYDLKPPDPAYDTVNEYLVDWWKGEARESAGYRTLTDWLNKRVLKTVYDNEGLSYPGGRIESDYRTIRDGDDLAKQELIDYLESRDIDAEAIHSQMVSWSTMRHHLNGCLDASKPQAVATTDWERESVRKASEQLTAKVERALTSLDNKDQLSGGSDVGIDVRIELECPECQLRVPFQQALRRGFVCEEHSTTTTSNDLEPEN